MIAHPHIRLDERGVAWLEDANVKVIEVVLDRLGYGWSPEEIHLQHRHLSLAQIHAALAHYYDHQATLDAEMAREEQTVRRLRREAGDSPLVAGLKVRAACCLERPPLHGRSRPTCQNGRRAAPGRRCRDGSGGRCLCPQRPRASGRGRRAWARPVHVQPAGQHLRLREVEKKIAPQCFFGQEGRPMRFDILGAGRRRRKESRTSWRTPPVVLVKGAGERGHGQ